MKNEKKKFGFIKFLSNSTSSCILNLGKGTSRSNTGRAEITGTPKEFSGTSCIRYGF